MTAARGPGRPANLAEEVPLLRAVPLPEAPPASGDHVTPSRWASSRGKRLLDVVLAIASLPASIPLIAILGGVSAIRFRCNPFFVQWRRGTQEVPFRVIKIRSLPVDFDQRRGKHELSEHQFEGWSRFLRDSHLDELPQVWNVIAGTMSLVGPRPMIDEVVATLEPDDRRHRALVKPGLTGPWQVSTMGVLSLHDHPELDNEYVRSASLRSDLWTMALTGLVMLGRKPFTPVELAKILRW